MVNAFGALGGFWAVDMTGPNLLEPIGGGTASGNYSATPVGGSGPYTYLWSTTNPGVQLVGTTNATVTAYADEADEPGFNLTVTMVDLSDGATASKQLWVNVLACDEGEPECEF